MVQKQLVDYIKAQIKVGVGKEELKGALLDAGWNEADINDSVENATGTVGAAASTASVPAGVVSAGNPIIVSDLLPSVPNVEAAAAKPEKEKSGGSEPKVRFGTKLLKLDLKTAVTVIVAIVALGFAGASVYFYVQFKNTQDKFVLLSGASGAAESQLAALNSQVADLTKAKDDLASQVSSLTNANKELADKLLFFAVPEGLGTSSAATVNFGGVLGGGGKSEYSITASSGIKVFVSNSKDTKVDEALKSLVGQNVQISGTHMPGLREVTVTTINGTAVVQ